MVNTIEDIDFNGYVIAAVEGYGTTCLHVLKYWRAADTRYKCRHWMEVDELAQATFYETSDAAELTLMKKVGDIALAMTYLKNELKDTFLDVEFQVMQVHGTVTLNRMFTFTGIL